MADRFLASEVLWRRVETLKARVNKEVTDE